MAKATGRSATHVALLRGINVGGKNKLPMKDLVRIFEAEGAASTRTYIQSGNVLFRASASRAKQVPAAVSRRISEELGLEVPVVLRSVRQLSAAVQRHPFAGDDIDLKWLHIMFAADKPRAAAMRGLDHERSPHDRFEVIGSEIHIHFGKGSARSKLTNVWFDQQLDTVTTSRNLRTCRKLLELAGA